MKVTVDVRKRLAAKMRKTAASVDSNVNRAVAEVGEDLLSACIPVTPMSAEKDAGDLRRSGYVDHRVPGTAVVGFSAPYAVYVHEMGADDDRTDDDPTDDPDARINWTTPGTGAKFLTGPFLLNRARYKDHIMDAARKGLT